MNVAESIVETLVENNIKTFFGIPGGPISFVFNAVLNNKKATLIQSRQETGAIFSAIGYYRTTKQIPCILVTAGPGITNCITGLTTAFLEGIPMVIICGDTDWSSEKQVLQNCGPEGIDIENVLKPLVSNSYRLLNENSAKTKTFASISSCIKNKRPSLLVTPINISAMQCKNNPKIEFINDKTIGLIIKRINKSQFPLVVLGGGCHENSKEVRNFINNIKIPFITTPRAKGVVSENHPFSLRNGGLAASKWAQTYVKNKIDLLIVIGTDLDDCSIGALQYSNDETFVVHIDQNASIFNKNIKTNIGIVADIKEFCKEFPVFNKNKKLYDLIKNIKKQSPTEPFQTKTNCISPQQAVISLQKVFESARFVTDIGEHMLFALHYLNANTPDSFLINIGLGSMGSGIGSAIGMALEKNKTIVCICGDGCMQMLGMEALVAIKHNLPIVFAVFNDFRYNMVYHGYKDIFQEEESWETPKIDFSMWANSIGMKSFTINSINDLMLVSPNITSPILLDIRIDRSIKFSGGGRNESLKKMSIGLEM